MILKNLQTLDDVGDFQLRYLDEMECAKSGLTPEQALYFCLEASDVAFGLWVDDELLAVWGWRRASFVAGGVEFWLLTTPLVDTHKKLFLRQVREFMGLLLREYGSIAVRIWDGHFQARRLAKRLGFKVAYVSGNELYAVKTWSA